MVEIKANSLSIAMPEQRLRIYAGVAQLPYPEAADLIDAGSFGRVLREQCGIGGVARFLAAPCSRTGAHPLALGVLQYEQEQSAVGA